ncbi:Glycosyl transferase, group 1, partial [human gut metagenome]
LIDNFYIDKMKTTVIYNPVDIKYIDSLKNEEIEDKYKYIFDENTIITSGRLTYQKGQWYLIRALKKVKKELPNAKLVILGQGELEKNLKKLVAELNLEDSVFFLGFKSNPFKYIKNSKVFVLPSLFEGFGNVITETMECGTIVISTDCKSGPKEILNPSNMEEKVNDMFIANYGILIPVFDGKVYNATEKLTKEEDILANTIIEVLKNMQLCLQLESKIFERVKDFEVNSIVKEWCKF